jgi:hypothetical protein
LGAYDAKRTDFAAAVIPHNMKLTFREICHKIYDIASSSMVGGLHAKAA